MPRDEEPVKKVEEKKEEKVKVVEVPVEVQINLALLNEKLNLIMKNQQAIFNALENLKK